MNNKAETAPQKIRKALLELKKEYPFEHISVAAICRKANVSRTAFYRYYSKPEDVLNELIQEVLSQSESYRDEIIAQISGNEEREKAPICEFLRAHKEYKPIFSDAMLLHIVIRTIVQTQKESFFELIQEKSQLSNHQAELLLYHHVSGCLAAINRSYSLSDEEWNQVRDYIDKSISNIQKDILRGQ